ncbi:MAG: MmgE/PrpD family protein, partial [Pseudomonadota bacterium]
SEVTVTLRDGRVLSSGDIHARGWPEAPMDLSEVEAKFHAMSGRLPDARKSAIWDMRARLLEPEARFGDLLALLHAPVNQP